MEKSKEHKEQTNYFWIFFISFPPVLGGSIAFLRDADTVGYIQLIVASYIFAPLFFQLVFGLFFVWFKAFEGGKIIFTTSLLASAISVWYGINESFPIFGIIALGLAGPLIGLFFGGALALFLYALPFIAAFLFIDYAADNTIPFFAIVFSVALLISFVHSFKKSGRISEIYHSIALAFASAVIATLVIQGLNVIGESLSKGGIEGYEAQCSSNGCR